MVIHTCKFPQSLEKHQPLPSSSSTTPCSSTKKDSLNCNQLDKQRDDRKEDGMLDIRTLREKSRNLDLPLISALCNDRYLLKQTKAFVLPKHPIDNSNNTGNNGGGGSSSSTTSTSLVTKSNVRNSNVTNNSSHSTSNNGNNANSKNKYPVSGLSTTQISKPPRKSSTSNHRHPTEVKGNAYKISKNSATTSVKKDPNGRSFQS